MSDTVELSDWLKGEAAYTKSGAFLAAQPQEYRDYEPFLVREPKYLTVADVRGAIEGLDQTA